MAFVTHVPGLLLTVVTLPTQAHNPVRSLRSGAAAAHVEVDLLNIFPEEPNGPIVKIPIPGPIAKKTIADLDK